MYVDLIAVPATAMAAAEARRNDLDVDRDGNITRDELLRYIGAAFW